MGLFNRHKHVWEETGRKFFPPEYEVRETWGHLSFDHKKLIFGYTTITYRCKDCGIIDTSTKIGEVP